jgi:hypothetical protein
MLLKVYIRSIENSNDLIGNRNRDLPACSLVKADRLVNIFSNCPPYFGFLRRFQRLSTDFKKEYLQFDY